MLPQATGLSTVETTDNGILLAPRNKAYPITESWEQGGVGLSDTSQGLISHTWRAWTDSKAIYIQRSDLPKDTSKTLLAVSDITEVDLTFDQNMRPVLTYVSGGIAKLYWYDTVSQSQVITDFSNAKNPRVSLDDKRAFNTANSDVIFAYINNDQLCCRYQRERYGIEHVLHQLPPKTELVKIGMGTANRFLFDTKEPK
ncbi:hypothetical protein AFK20_01645 [Enhydrobacter aerosaccus]|uniref:Uncharacterized protein n=1 Tax=Enhydrobacter aerosaccus TaxID=225324 RepID=A0ABR5IPA8_9HYPH|nr:hypothetical protein [Enhydrobacter aerosaccus]KND22827.1 hypothetical protein AFK20_01645 [Enhydrobacter aerosaccus]